MAACNLSSEEECEDVTILEKRVQEDKDSTKKHEESSNLPQKLRFKCPMENCDAAYRKNWLLEEHILKHNKERPFVCSVPECSKSFTKDAHLKRHKVMVHEKSCQQTCDIKGCGKKFNNKYSLKKHVSKVHSEKSYPFFCSECNKGFDKKSKLNQHMYIHTGEPPFKCNECNLGFIVARDLNKHNRNHKSYTCECGEIFKKWTRFRFHKKDECERIEKKCKNCDKVFSKKNNLREHYKLCNKNNTENFRCPYLDCSRTYLHKKNLKWHINNNHEKNKTVVENYKCTETGCDKVFHYKLYLKRHIKRLHTEKPKTCKPRAPRKDKGKPKTFIAATLAGIRLSQKQHIDALKGDMNPLQYISEIKPVEECCSA